MIVRRFNAPTSITFNIEETIKTGNTHKDRQYGNGAIYELPMYDNININSQNFPKKIMKKVNKVNNSLNLINQIFKFINQIFNLDINILITFIVSTICTIFSYVFTGIVGMLITMILGLFYVCVSNIDFNTIVKKLFKVKQNNLKTGKFINKTTSQFNNFDNFSFNNKTAVLMPKSATGYLY